MSGSKTIKKKSEDEFSRFVESLKNSKIYEPQKGEWTDYIEDDDPDFYDTSVTDDNGKYKRLPIAPHQILECIMNSKTLLNISV